MTVFNASPVRTCNNFNINDIKIDTSNFESKHTFDGMYVVNKAKDNILADGLNKNISFKYGLNDDMNKNILQDANSRLKLELNSKKMENATIGFKFSKKDSYLKNITEICANENSKVALVIKFESIDDVKAFSTSYLKFIIKQNAYLNVVVINMLNDSSLNLLGAEAQVEENANLDVTIINLGACSNVINYYSSLNGENSKNNLKCIYIGNKNSMIDLNYIMSIRNVNSSVNMDVKGALLDTAKKHFKGTISFEKGSKKSKAQESEFTYLLSKDVKSISLPMLLCKEDDVEGDHSSAAGRIDKDILFYLMSRGISEKDAIKLIIKAKFNDILYSIEDEELVNQVITSINEKLT